LKASLKLIQIPQKEAPIGPVAIEADSVTC
jgi:hypothetical protein